MKVAPAVDRALKTIAGGGLRERRTFGVRFWDGSALPPRGDAGPTIVVSDPAALAHVAREPNQLGLGRAWVSGMLDVEGDLDAVLALRHDFEGLRLSGRDRLRTALLALRLVGPRVLRRPPLPTAEARLSGRRHSLQRDSDAVRHHYDVPESFYRLVLGPTMVYSCAYFASPDDSLEEAQERKLELVCRKLRLEAGDRLLDVGCGWGSLILHAAMHHGVRGVGVTLSPAQADVARRRIREAGVDDLCEVRVADYREVADGPYDAIASIGMYEHVGRSEITTYAQKLASMVRPGGLILNHGITRLTPGARSTRTFIGRFVFPDGELHPLTTVLRALESAGLELRDVESLREHYVLTLRRWLANLAANRAAAIAAADRERERVWRLYMTASASGFDDGDISVFQTLVAKPGAAHRLPLGRPEQASLDEPATSD